MNLTGMTFSNVSFVNPSFASLRHVAVLSFLEELLGLKTRPHVVENMANDRHHQSEDTGTYTGNLVYVSIYIHTCYSIDCLFSFSMQLHIDLEKNILNRKADSPISRGFPSILVEFKNPFNKVNVIVNLCCGKNTRKKKQLKTQHSLTQVGLK